MENDEASKRATERVLDGLLLVVIVAFVMALLTGCVNQYKNRITVEVPPGSSAGSITIHVTDYGDQVPTSSKNVVPSITASGLPGM